MPKSTAEIVKTKSGKFRVKYYAANGEMLACSEELKTKASAKKNIAAMRKLFIWIPVVTLRGSDISAALNKAVAKKPIL